MGLQNVTITLKALATSLTARSQRGIVCIVVDEPLLTGVHTYTKLNNVVESYSTANKAIITRCFSKYGVKTLKVACYNSTATTPETISNALSLLSGTKFNYLACPTALDSDKATIANFIKTQRNANNILVKTVLNNKDIADDYEGVIDFINNSITMDGIVYTGVEFCVDFACFVAGISLTESITNMTISGITAVDIVGTDLDALVDAGKIFLFYDEDLEEYVFSRGVNSKTTIGTDEKASMKKIRIMDILDMIRNDLKTTYKSGYQGKVENSLENKKLLVSAFNNYLRTLALQGVLSTTQTSYVELDVVATTNYLEAKGIDCSSLTDAQILAIDTDEETFVTGTIYPLDKSEDLTLNLNY